MTPEAMNRIRDLAALDQLEACVENHSDSPNYSLVKEYCGLVRKAIALREEIALGSLSPDRYRAEVIPLLQRISEVRGTLFSRYSGFMTEDEGEFGMGGDWWKG